jgi:putative ABC transport system substrate-binding protein
MNGCIKVLSTVFALLMIMTAIVLPAGADSAKALLIYWRGETPCEKALKSGLKDLGVNIQLSEFDAQQDKARLGNYLATIDEKKFDFIYTFGTTASLETAKVVKQTPILFGIVTNPVQAGLIQSWESSGNNVTGVSHAVPYQDQVDFMTRLGKFERVGILYDQNVANAQIAFDELKKLLGEKGIKIVGAPVTSEADLETGIKTLADQKVDLVYLPSDSLIISKADSIVAALNARKIPTYGAVESFMQKGALAGIVSSYEMVGKALVEKAAKILKGTPVSQIPSSHLPFEMLTAIVNAKTAQQVGVSVPYEVLSQAQILE